MPEEMRIGARALSIILGGPGIFYIWHSFYAPFDAVKAVIFLGAATAINLMLYPEAIDASGGVAALNKALAKFATWKRRR